MHLKVRRNLMAYKNRSAKLTKKTKLISKVTTTVVVKPQYLQLFLK